MKRFRNMLIVLNYGRIWQHLTSAEANGLNNNNNNDSYNLLTSNSRHKQLEFTLTYSNALGTSKALDTSSSDYSLLHRYSGFPSQIQPNI